MKMYWVRFIALPVTLHLKRDREFVWTGIFGVQIGEWFFGAISGSEREEVSE